MTRSKINIKSLETKTVNLNFMKQWYARPILFGTAIGTVILVIAVIFGFAIPDIGDPLLLTPEHWMWYALIIFGYVTPIITLIFFNAYRMKKIHRFFHRRRGFGITMVALLAVNIVVFLFSGIAGTIIAPTRPSEEFSTGLIRIDIYDPLNDVDLTNATIDLYWYDNETYYRTLAPGEEYYMLGATMAHVYLDGWYELLGIPEGWGNNTLRVNTFTMFKITPTSGVTARIISRNDTWGNYTYADFNAAGTYRIKTQLTINDTYRLKSVYGPATYLPLPLIPEYGYAYNYSVQGKTTFFYFGCDPTVVTVSNAWFQDRYYTLYNISTGPNQGWVMQYYGTDTDIILDLRFTISGPLTSMGIFYGFLDNVSNYLDFQFV